MRGNITFLLCVLTSFTFAQKALIDFFLPMDSKFELVKEGAWGGESIFPRDTTNGLEGKSSFNTKTGKYHLKDWCYWDGSIVKDDEGKYHMYASRWSQTFRHSTGWKKDSKGIHAVSDHLQGPYIDMGLTWPYWMDGRGHNVIGLRMHDGRYAMVTSENVPGQVFVSDNPDGPFELLGDFKIDANGYYPGWGRYNELDFGAVRGGSVGFLANVMIILRPDGRYMMLARHCVPMISEGGILGPYKMLGHKAWLGIEGLPQFKMEDPTIWYADSLYHIVVNYHGADSTFHLTSEDGLQNWKYRGIAFSRNGNVFKHNDGTVEKWATVQRATVYKEDDEVKAFNFSVIDVHKGQDVANDENGSKVMVVPFDGEAFGKHIREIVDKENEQSDATPPPLPWQSASIGNVHQKGNAGYDKLVSTIRMQATGNKLESNKDAFHFTYQRMAGDVLVKTFLLTDDIAGGEIQSGLMLRNSLEEDAPFVFASFTKNGGFTLKQRATKGEMVAILKTQQRRTPYWIMLKKLGAKISCYVSSSNRMNWEFFGETEIDLEEQFYIGMASTSNGSKTSSLARFKNVDAHQYGHPPKDGIVMHTFPDTIPASGIIEFEVELESVRTSDIWVELECVQTGEKFNVLRERFWKSGTKKLVYDAGKPLDTEHTYWFVIKAVQMHFHDSEHHDAGFKKVRVEKQ